MATVSAALIVRDEERVIEGCLESLAGIVDEIVVVDTGSRDRTIARAARFPVKLAHFAWCDDFSAARNYAIEQASGDWILYIDADERLAPIAPAQLQDLLGVAGKAAWKVRLHPRLGWSAYGELRLFRRDPRIRFRGVIHERVHEAVELVCLADGLDIGMSEIALQHIGYEDDQSQKNPRNLPLLRAYLEREPDRLFCWWHLGESLRLAGDWDGAERAWRDGIAALSRQPAGALRTSASMIMLSLIKLRSERSAPIDDLLGQALELFPGHLGLAFIAAKRAIERGAYREAEATLTALAAVDPATFFDEEIAYDLALFGALPREALAVCCFRSRRYEEAARWFREAAARSPDPQACEIKARLAELRSNPRPRPRSGDAIGAAEQAL
jgi:tetratricopeptide (TPR) repeat protein